MNTLTNTPTNQATTGALVIGLAVSIGVHLLVGSVAVRSALPQTLAGSGAELEFDPPETLVPPEIDLGIEESTVASIAWLGVEKNEQEGIADPSTVDQAALSTNPSDASVPSEPVQSPPPEPEASEPIEPPVQPSAQPSGESSVAEEPVRPNRTPSPAITQSPDPQVIIVEPAPPTEDPDPVPEEVSEQEPKPTDDAGKAPADPESVAQPEPAPPVTQTPSSEPPKPAVPTPGLPGEKARREAVASAIRNAEEVLYNQMHLPLSTQGLELQPKQPQFPLSVRNAALPKNAVVLIRFGRDGKVRSADFLVSADGKARYDTGRLEIDAPLMAAIYQWTAKGKRLLELDPADPTATIEIPMRFLFAKPRYEKTGG